MLGRLDVQQAEDRGGDGHGDPALAKAARVRPGALQQAIEADDHLANAGLEQPAEHGFLAQRGQYQGPEEGQQLDADPNLRMMKGFEDRVDRQLALGEQPGDPLAHPRNRAGHRQPDDRPADRRSEIAPKRSSPQAQAAQATPEGRRRDPQAHHDGQDEHGVHGQDGTRQGRRTRRCPAGLGAVRVQGGGGGEGRVVGHGVAQQNNPQPAQ